MTYTLEEQKQHRQEWIKALRSGDYKQTNGNLRDENGYCCLGVACDISGLGVWKKYRNALYEYNSIEEHVWTEAIELPVVVRNYFGLITVQGKYFKSTLENEIDSLMIANDGNLSFDQIADIIESEPYGFFT